MKRIRIEKINNFRFSSNTRPRSTKNTSNSRSPKNSTGIFTKLNLANPQLRSLRNEVPLTGKSRKLFHFFPDSPKKSSIAKALTNNKPSKFSFPKEKPLNLTLKQSEPRIGYSLVQFLKEFQAELTDFELSEILGYKTIFYWGDMKVKLLKTTKYKSFDDESDNLLLFKGDHIAYRYEIIKILGYGSFGQVCECIDHKENEKVAVKIIKSPKNFSIQAENEIKILTYISTHTESLPIIKLRESFNFRKHVCIVTDLLGQNLYELQHSKAFSPFPEPLLRSFSIQILTALTFLADHRIIHCDLKLENILLSSNDSNTLKIIDFGSSCFLNEKVFSYIQSRYYRAPEVVLNLNYGCGIDIWSFGCIIAELASGKPLFPAECERELIQLMMQLKGRVPEEMLEKSIKKSKFFAQGSVLPDKYGNILVPGSIEFQEAVKGEPVFLEFVQRCLEWDPAKRITPHEALQHPWILAEENRIGQKTQILKLLRRSKFFKKIRS